MPIRRAIGRRTIFNLLGPLCNPAGVTRQLVGVPSPALIATYSKAMALLGMESAMIVSGDEGLDELSVSTASTISDLAGDQRRLAPGELDLGPHPFEALRGGDAPYNAEALRRMLAGERGAYRDAVVLNSAAALIVAGHTDSWQEGVEDAAEAIDKGLAKALLDCWIAY
jgi:anthranilate phosphoribosyltransferase